MKAQAAQCIAARRFNENLIFVDLDGAQKKTGVKQREGKDQQGHLERIQSKLCEGRKPKGAEER